MPSDFVSFSFFVFLVPVRKRSVVIDLVPRPMVRPRDLPQPVREHAPHESLTDRYQCSPGPGAYHVSGCTSQNLSLGARSFTRAARFQTKSQRGDVHPGPCYNPSLPRTTLAVTFKGASGGSERHSATHLAPGPGAYDITTEGSGPSIGFPKSSRDAVARTHAAAASPAPGAYNPRKVGPRKATAFIGSSKRTDAFGAFDGTETARMTPLAAMDRALDATRPPVAPDIGFARASRDGARCSARGSVDVAPGQYNVLDDYVRPNRLGTTFGSAPRLSQERHGGGSSSGSSWPITGSGMFRAQSTKPSTPSASFSKAVRCGSADRGSSRLYIGTESTSMRDTSYAQVDSAVKLCVAWKPPSRPASAAASCATASGPEYMSAMSSLDGPTVSFPKSKRQGLVRGDAPGPGTYNVLPRRRPESATRSIGKARRDFRLGPGDEGALGDGGGPALGYPTIALTKPSNPMLSFPREPRGGRPASAPSARTHDSQGPSGLDYSPSYSQLERNPRAAVLYLTG